MKLLINTTSAEKIVLHLNEVEYEADARKEKSQRLLPFIVESLKQEGKTLQDLTEIEVATGSGSFTGIRVGTSVAQGLGYMLGIPVNGMRVDQGEALQILYN